MVKTVIASPEAVSYICKRFGIRMSKKLGQNFLIKRTIVDSIVAAADLKEGEAVLEIGPGIGTLTQGLAEANVNVTAIELDKRLIDVLHVTLSDYENVRIVQGDALRLNIAEMMNEASFKVVANLPYYITTPIILSLLESKLPIERLVVMIQKEVAERIIAKPGSKAYGALSVAVQYYTEPMIVLEVSGKSFLPPPEVMSAVICCKRRKTPPVEVDDEKLFFRVVKGAFAQRRKTLLNTLRTIGLTKEEVSALLIKVKIDPTRRGETLSLEEFAAIANAWYEGI